MLKKVISYTDFDGVDRTETFYFNLTKSEIVEMEMSIDGGLAKMVESIVAAQDKPHMIAIFKDFILKSYGEKSPDGKRFVKSPELSTAFSQTMAYDQLFMEIANDGTAAANFINAIVPTVPEKN